MPLGLSNRAAAKVVNVSHSAIAKAIKTGHLSTLSDGSIDQDALIRWSEQRPISGGNRSGNLDAVATLVSTEVSTAADEAVERIIAASGIPTHDRPEAERIKANYEALLKQLDYDIRSSRVVLVEDVAKSVGTEYAQVRTKLLAIPAEQAPQIHRLKTVAEVQSKLHEVIVEALESLTRDAGT